jgi:hypothetical protein
MHKSLRTVRVEELAVPRKEASIENGGMLRELGPIIVVDSYVAGSEEYFGGVLTTDSSCTQR